MVEDVPKTESSARSARMLKAVAGILLLGAGAAAAAGWPFVSAAVPERPRPREVRFTYVAQVPGIPNGARELRVWVPLARTCREQEILSRDVRSPLPYTVTQDQEFGNEMLHLSVDSPLPESFAVTIEYRAQLPGPDGDPPPTPEELVRSLEPRGLVIVDAEVRERARHAAARRATRTEQARGIYEAVIRQVAYDKTVPGWGRGDTRRVCLLGAGNCTDFHSLFISMARAQRIPARFKIGIVIPETGSGTIPGYHCWAEFYDERAGWAPVDASEAWKRPEQEDDYFGTHDPNRLLLSVGRDIQLSPRPQGGPVNIFFYPHVEVDGLVIDGVETELRYQVLL